MSRDILAGLDDAGIGIASATYDIVGLPPVALERPPAVSARRGAARDPDLYEETTHE